MSSTRLFILATLDRHGPMHGHQILHDVQEGRRQLWSDIPPGSLCGVLGRLQREGLIEAIRTERQGNYPERVVYAITEDGRRSLRVVRDDVLRAVGEAFDPFDLALATLGPIAPDHLTLLLRNRLDQLVVRRNIFAQQRDAAMPWLTTAEALVFGHVLRRLDTDIAWHEELIGQAPVIAAEATAGMEHGSSPPPSPGTGDASPPRPGET